MRHLLLARAVRLREPREPIRVTYDRLGTRWPGGMCELEEPLLAPRRRGGLRDGGVAASLGSLGIALLHG